MATVRKNRDRWVADYRDQHGRRRIEVPDGPFENKEQERRAAQALLAKRLTEISRGDFQPHRLRLTFGQVCDRYIESKVAIRPSTRRNYSGLIDLYLKPYFGQWKVSEIGAASIERFRTEMANGLPPSVVAAIAARATASKSSMSEGRAIQRSRRDRAGTRTINKCLTLLTMIFNYAARHRWVDHNAAEYVEKIKTPPTDSHLIDNNVLTPDEVRRLLDASNPGDRDRDGHWISINYRLLIRTAIYTGMRQGELFGLQWGDIDWNARQVFVRRTWKDGSFHEPKTRTSQRRIDLPQSLLGELKAWRLACPKGARDLVFSNLEGNPLSHVNVVQRGLAQALRRAGLRQIRFHDLRHTFASLLIAQGEDVVRVSRLLGHASPAITLNVYSHMLPKEHYASADRLADLIESGNGNKLDTIAGDAATDGGKTCVSR